MLTGTTSITANASLVGKVKFPRAVLPLASVGGALMHFMLQSVAFAVVLLVTRHSVDWAYMWLLPDRAARRRRSSSAASCCCWPRST